MTATYKEYTVKAGEHLMAIALEHLGSKARYIEIMNAEGKAIAEPDKLKPGDVLRIPVADPAKLKPGEVARVATSAAGDAKQKPDALPYFEYTVKAGDGLMAIALEHLGAKTRYTEILDAEGKPLADPNKIKPGDVLRIPKK